MNMPATIRRRFGILVLAGLVVLPVALTVWWANLEAAIGVFRPDWGCLAAVMPPRLHRTLSFLAADLSTISTLIPLLLLFFPWRRAVIIWRRTDPPAAAAEPAADPYPPRFAFFLVMLGLTGTLYGLLIGLDTSGITAIGSRTPTAEDIRASIDRLMGGTATALLSSLVGLAGAFVAAQPVPWLFRRLAGASAATEPAGIAEVIQQLTDDLRELGRAGRAVTEQLRPEVAGRLFDAIDRQTSVITATGQSIEKLHTGLETAVALGQAASRQLRHLDPIASALQSLDSQCVDLRAIVGAMAENQSAAAAQLADMTGQQNARLTQLQDLLDGFFKKLEAAQHNAECDRKAMQQQIGQLLQTMAQRDTARQREQSALRRALAAFMDPPQ